MANVTLQDKMRGCIAGCFLGSAMGAPVEHLNTYQNIEEKYGYEVVNYGTDSTERFNYPVSGEAVANAVVSGEVDKGIVICGTGVGISLAANKVNGIRCVTCSEPYSALLSRQHNNTNMLAFGARVVGIELAKMIVDAWLSGEYEGGRHQVRIDMLKEIEEKQKNK